MPPHVKLPVLPAVVQDFSRKADDPQVGSRELGNLIETDATLTYELLKYANSSFAGSRSKLATPQQAISRLGIRASKSFLMSTAVNQMMKRFQSKLFNVQSLWLTNLERALFAAEIARQLRTDPELAYSGSLLQDFLLPVLGNELSDIYLEHLQADSTTRPPLVQLERKRLGWDHAQAAAALLLGWGLPDDLVCCVALHHQGLTVLHDQILGRTAVAAIAVAALIPDPLRQTSDGLEQLVMLDAIWPKLRLTETAAHVAAQLAELTPLSAQHATLSRRLERHLSPAV